MAPKGRASKRASSATAASPSKARKVAQAPAPYAKYGVTKQSFEAVEEGIKLADLSEDCRAMLLAMAPHSICVPSDERSEQQAMVVDMLDEVFKAVVAKLEGAVADAAAAVSAVDESRSEQEAKVASAESALGTAEAAADAAKATLAQKTIDVTEAKKALAAKQDEQKKGDARSTAAEKEKQVFEGCAATEYKALKETTWEKPAEAKKLYNAVDKVLKQLKLEESMVAALPGTLQRKAADRGSFDQMLLEQCDKLLQDKIDELAAEIAAAAPAAAERAAAVEAAQGHLLAATSAQEAAAGDLAGAQAALKDAKAALKSAKDEFAKSEPAKQEAVSAHDEKKAALENFNFFSVATFSTLKTKTSPQKEEAPAAEEAKEAAEAAPEAAPEAEVAA